MKRILAVTAALVLTLSALVACTQPQNPSGREGEKPERSRYLSEKDGVYVLTLPKSKEEIELYEQQVRFVPYVTDSLVEAAEKKIIDEVSQYSSRSDFFLQITDDYLCLVAEVIKSIDPPASAEEGEFAEGGCGGDHEHLFFGERISSRAVADGSSFATGDEDYAKVQFFPHPTPEFTEEDAFEIDTLEWARLRESDMDLLRDIYGNGEGWMNDAVVDRAPFLFDGRIRFATLDTCGWMYYGFEQDVLYYNGEFKGMNVKEKDILQDILSACTRITP